MSYSSVSQCRFFIDTFLWYTSAGMGTPVTENDKTVFDLNPANRGEAASQWGYTTSLKIEKINYYAILGHNIPNDVSINGAFQEGGTTAGPSILETKDWVIDVDDSINFTGGSGANVYAPKAGYSIAIVKDVGGEDIINIDGHNSFYLYISSGTAKIGAFSMGQTYTTPVSPDLNLKLTFETGTTTIETKSGASLSNTMWRPPMWGNLAPFEIYRDYGYQKLARSSRRIWDLSFSYLSKTDTFPKYNSLSTYGTDDYVEGDANEPDQYTLVESEDFYSVVWNRVGNSLPFIFQPDVNENIYAICKFDMRSLEVAQVAFGVYTVKLKIREIF